MYAIPQLMAVPALTGVGPVAMDWPTLGVFLGWMLIAALVGAGLGALRRMSVQPPAVLRHCAAHPGVQGTPTPVDHDHRHQEAA